MHQNTRPSLSIITVTYNAASTLEACIESILLHKGEDVEFLVIDGGSKDGTSEILSKYRKSIDVLVSEPDNGIYDAMNKGLDLATGDYIIFLGADDILLHLPRESLLLGADLVLCDVDCGGWKFQHARPEGKLRAQIRYRNSIHPQGTFYRRSTIRYSLKFRFCADYLFNILHISTCTNVVYFDRPVSRFCTDGASAGWAAKSEAIRIAALSFGPIAGIRSFTYHLGSHILNLLRKRGEA